MSISFALFSSVFSAHATAPAHELGLGLSASTSPQLAPGLHYAGRVHRNWKLAGSLDFPTYSFDRGPLAIVLPRFGVVYNPEGEGLSPHVGLYTAGPAMIASLALIGPIDFERGVADSPVGSLAVFGPMVAARVEGGASWTSGRAVVSGGLAFDAYMAVMASEKGKLRADEFVHPWVRAAVRF